MFTNTNTILAVDSYKASHFLAFPQEAAFMHYYIESRGGAFDRTLWFGPQAMAKTYLSKPITRADIDEAEDYFVPHGLPFNKAGWLHILNKHGGNLPLVIRALPEGVVVPTHTALMTVQNTDPAVPWLAGYAETLMLRAVWYPTTVATVSWHGKKIIRRWLAKTGGDPALADFMLHDFGARGASSGETAMLGGMAHLVNFKGTDTVEALVGARRLYGEPMAGFSIPAAEHSVITSWGREREVDAYRAMLRAAGAGMVAVVSDSYDLMHAVTELWGGSLKEEVLARGGRTIIRPDSGYPPAIVLETVQRLDAAFGHSVNEKGFKVLHPAVRVIQGDGIDLDMIDLILKTLAEAGYAAENLAFGMGGALLQKVNRDTLRFAEKASAMADREGNWRGFNKSPATDPTKASKAGRLAVIHEGGRWETVPLDGNGYRDQLIPFWRDGQMLRETTFGQVRERAAAALEAALAEPATALAA